jgi:creatinine amidohydrolase
LAKKCGFIVFPTISYGLSFEHEPLSSISIRDVDYRSFLDDILWSLGKMSVNLSSVIILNGHHGNLEALKKLPTYLKKHFAPHEGMPKCYSYWHFMKHEFDHAGFVETSLMLAISDKVKMKKAKKGLIIENLSKLEQSAAKKLSTQPGGFPKVAKNGVWGDPTSATKKDGEKFLAEIVRNLAKECQS